MLLLRKCLVAPEADSQRIGVQGLGMLLASRSLPSAEAEHDGVLAIRSCVGLGSVSQ